MLCKTRGIVLGHLKYKDTSIIVHVFTEEFGRCSFIVNGVRSKKSKGKIAFFQPLTLLDMVIYRKSNNSLQRLSEYKNTYPFKDIPFNFHKTTVAIFTAEILSKCINDEHPDEMLFGDLYRFIIELDGAGNHTINFPIYLILILIRHFGVYPENLEELESQYASHYKKRFTHEMSDVEVQKMNQLIKSGISELDLLGDQRRKILQVLIDFLAINIESLHFVKSLEVLHDVYHS